MTASDIAFSHPHPVASLWTPTLRRLQRVIHRLAWFHVVFISLGLLELACFLSFVKGLSHPTVLAFTLALFFLTIFAFLILRLYLLAKRAETIVDLIDEYLVRCKEMLRYQEGVPEHHIALANAAHKLAHHLHEKEYTYFVPPPVLNNLSLSLEKLSCFCYWKDLFLTKELLLQTAVEEHIKVVKCEPTNLEVHAALANAYVTLSALYADPRKYPGYDDEKWIPPELCSQEMQRKFRSTAERAIEEFKILKDYAPHDPWVHMQLAYSYHDLQMPQEEIFEYEALLQLKPDDTDTLFKLGVLYFQQGENAKGLHIYEKLKHTHFKKAESLIKFYGTSYIIH